MPSTSEHWDQIDTTRAMETLSWFEATPDLSLELVQTDGRPASVIDVGAGESLLTDSLFALGISDVTVLDISSTALDAVRARVAPHSITTICADVLEWEPDRTWHVWHDRAVFHFLTEAAQRTAYVERAATAVEPGGVLPIHRRLVEHELAHADAAPVCGRSSDAHGFPEPGRPTPARHARVRCRRGQDCRRPAHRGARTPRPGPCTDRVGTARESGPRDRRRDRGTRAVVGRDPAPRNDARCRGGRHAHLGRDRATVRRAPRPARRLSLRIEYHELVDTDLEHAWNWYEDRQHGLGDRFLEATLATVVRASRWPNAGAPVLRDDNDESIERKLPTNGFPYAVRYRIHDDRLLVMAVHHQHRVPTFGTDRRP